MELFKIRVQNLGRIKGAELRIRPLTIFCGPNNTNKTWMAYAIYGLAQRLSQRVESGFTGDVKNMLDTFTIDAEISRIVDAEVSRFVELAKSSRDDALLVDKIERSSLTERLKYPVAIRVGAAGLSQLVGASVDDMEDSSVTLEIGKSRFATPQSETVSLRFHKGAPMIFGARFGEKWISNSELGRLDYDLLGADCVKPALENLMFAILRQVVAFPAERKCLNLLYSVVELGQLDGLNLPVRRYVNLMKMLARPSDLSGMGRDDVLRPLEKFLGGEIAVEGGETGRAITFRFGRGHTLRLPAVSSLVRSMAGIALYLAKSCATGDLVIIDEPEMNAHPEAQLMIAELLGILVHHGVNVVITTHSPYIVDHINNLMEAAEVPVAQQETVARRFSLGLKEAFVPTEKVAAYVFDEDGSVTDAIDRENRIIDWSTFGRISDRVGNLYSDILEASRPE